MPVWGLWKMISFTSMRKERILRCWGIILPVALLIYIMLCRFLPGCARGYADYVYPNVSFVLSAVSSVIPVSWEEIMAVVVVSLMIFIPVMARRRGEGWLVYFPTFDFVGIVDNHLVLYGMGIELLPSESLCAL